MNRKNKHGIMRFAGIFKDNSEAWEKIEKDIYSIRKKAKMRDF